MVHDAELMGANWPRGHVFGDVPLGHLFPSGHIVHVIFPLAL